MDNNDVNNISDPLQKEQKELLDALSGFFEAEGELDALQSRISAASEFLVSRFDAAGEGCGEHDLSALKACKETYEAIEKAEKQLIASAERFYRGMCSANEALEGIVSDTRKLLSMLEGGGASQTELHDAESRLREQEDGILNDYQELIRDICGETEAVMRSAGRLEELVSAVERICKAE